MTPTAGEGAPDLDAVEAALLRHPSPVVTTSDLAAALDCSRRHVLDQLRLLEHADDVASKQTGAKAVAWWHCDRVRGPLPQGSTADKPPSGDGTDRGDGGDGDVDAGDAGDDRGDGGDGGDGGDVDADPIQQRIDAAVAAAADGWDDDPDRRRDRRAAARAVLEALRDAPLSRSDIVEEFYDDYPVDGQNEDTWWRKNLAEGPAAPLKAVASYNRGTHKWALDDVDVDATDD